MGFFNNLRVAGWVVVLWLLSCSPTWGQDPLFSQFFNTPLHLNPAYVGINGGVTATATYRHQWNDIPGGFNTKYLSVESFEPCLPGALGLSVWRDTEGEGLLQTTAANAYFGFVARMENRKMIHNVRLSVSPYWMEKRIDWERLVFSDQLDARYGAINGSAFNSDFYAPAQFGGVNFGIVHRIDIRNGKKEDIQVDYGVGLNNLLNVSLNTGPIESLQGLETGLPLRWTAHASMYVPFLSIGESGINRMRIVPQVRVEGQGGLHAATFGVIGLYRGGSLGLFYHNRQPLDGFANTDALIAYLGLGLDIDKKQALEIGLSYDLNIGGLRSLSGGVLELNVRYFLKSSGTVCGLGKGSGSVGKSRRGTVQCPPVARSHHRRWNNIWYRN